MESTRLKKRNTLTVSPRLNPKDLFWAMACDLNLQQNPRIIDSYALLCNNKYLAFLSSLDGIALQMYELGVSKENLKRLHQITSLLSKFPFEDDSIDRDKIAIEKFLKSEHNCRRMNQKFRARRSRKEPAHMQYMRSFILDVIGSSPDMRSIYEKCDFGPGSAIGVSGNDVSILRKLDRLTVTPAALPVAMVCLMHNIHYSSYLMNGDIFCYDFASYCERLKAKSKLTEVQHNKIVCVPKNAKTSRTIAIEPSLNGFIQKGIDLVFRQKLKRIGIDLTRQDINQHYARLGSLDSSYATIDLSAASDSISIELVRELLPPEWFSLLNLSRSPSYLLDNKVTRYEKFCSMGNGFCFPLETLIFCAASSYAINQTADYGVKPIVYGDDIIVPQGSALLLLEVLRDIGFRHNESKTFIAGPFRESCGADYFFGENVRPIYVKDHLKLDHNAYYLLNRLRTMNMVKSWQCVFNALPPRFQKYLRPYHRECDSAITVDLDVFMTSRNAIWNRKTFSWNWKGIISASRPGRIPETKPGVEIGIFRGNFTTGSEWFSARYSEHTHVIVKT